MQLEERVREKFATLISTAGQLKQGNEHGQVLNENHRQECIGWLTSAHNLIHLVINKPDTPYRATVDRICGIDQGYCVQESVGEVCEILQSLLQDIDDGLLASIEDQTRASVFGDFLEHAKAYAKQKMPNEAGVIAGVVFEDTLRSICRNAGLKEKGEKLDNLINNLVKDGTLSQSKAKRARAAAHVRTKATHAQWDEFGLGDVKATIEFTEELIFKFLDK